MTYLLLLDAAPEPTTTAIGIAGLAFVVIVVLMITAAALVGAVFLFRMIKKSADRNTRMAVGDVDLNLDAAPGRSDPSLR